MATTVIPPLHARDSSINFDRDAGTTFSFPAQDRRQSTGYRFPPQYSSNEPSAFPGRRGSLPLMGHVVKFSNNARPRSIHVGGLNQLGAISNMMASCESSPDSRDYITSVPRTGGSSTYYSGTRASARTVVDGVLPTVLNATVHRGSSHTREASELLQVPTLEPQMDNLDVAPTQKRAPPPPGVNMRRGHAHRRSGAISSSDVWSLMKESPPPPPIPTHILQAPAAAAAAEITTSEPAHPSPKTSPRLSWSAPDSPGLLPGEWINSRISEVYADPCIVHLPAPSQEAPLDSADAERRQTRVCFTEKVEIIPRPASIATESSNANSVKSHNISDSISSVTSAAIDATPRVSSPARRQGRSRSNSQTLAQPTAALRALSDRSSDLPADRPSTAGAILNSVQTTKSLEIQEIPLFVLPANSPAAKSTKYKPHSKKPHSKKTHKKSKSDFSPQIVSSEFKSEDSANLSDGAEKKKKGKGKKQIKNWAGNILLGKGLKHPKKSGKSKSKRAPTPPISKSSEHLSPVENEWVATSWNESYVMMPVDASPVVDVSKGTGPGTNGSPVIDLDAALGPFQFPIESATGFAAARRRMHSAASRASGTHVHRRSESMPEMALFALEEDEDRTMEDVFEEEETGEDESTSEEESSEDDDDDASSQVDGLGIGIEEQVAEWPREIEAVRVATSTAQKRMSTGTLTAVTVSTSLITDITTDFPRRKSAPTDIITPHSEDPIIDTSFRQSFFGPSLDSPLTFVTAASSPNTPIQGDFPGEDYANIFDPYRDYLGEPGPEMRLSADDIPSLTSSSSTMTMNTAYRGMPSTPSSAHNIPLPSPISMGTKEKKERGKRWSRVFTFWKK